MARLSQSGTIDPAAAEHIQLLVGSAEVASWDCNNPAARKPGCPPGLFVGTSDSIIVRKPQLL